MSRTKKICTKCEVSKNINEFYKNGSGTKSICKICEKILKIEYNKNNKNKRQLANRKYYLNNKEKYVNKKWSEVSEEIKIGNRLRCRVRNALKGKIKSKPTWELLGCTMREFKTHLINKFTDTMTWNDVMNGNIHIDHIKPCINFDLSKKEEQKICFNYKNLQPLWKRDNLKKNRY